MQAVRHTPGPWDARGVGLHGSILIGPKGQNGRSIAKVFREGDNSEFEANARLIAAAPELLKAALELISAGDVFHGKDIPPVDYHPFAAKFRTAIAKAEWRTP